MATPPPESRPSLPIPAPLTSLVGREREVAQVRALLHREDVRLLTLTGPGGVGKSRLALASAASAAAGFADGLHFIPLATVQDPRLVAAVLAQAVGVRDLGALPFADQVRAVAGRSEALLLVDNFEHLMPAAPLLTELLMACPRLTILVTSREHLRLSGERELPVLPLACPDPERLPALEQVAAAPAIRLFVERALAAVPAFVLGDENAATVAAICHRLDGLPLALELAAARGPHLPPAALLARLARQLPLLSGGPRDVPARLRTMRDAIAWSHDLLSPEEQTHFRRLAIFVGGFTLDAAEVVAEKEGQSFDTVASLVDKSLVRRVALAVSDQAGSDDDANPRFEMLETIREFGLGQLAAAGEEDAVRAAHVVFYLGLADQAVLPGVNEPAAFDRLQADLANLRAALAWSCAGGSPDTALRLAARFGRFCFRRSQHHREGRAWLDHALAIAPDTEPALRSAALSARGDLLRELGEPVEAERSFTLACDLSRTASDRAGEATALTGLAALANDLAEYDKQKALCEASVAIWRELGDHRGLAHALHNQAWAEVGLGNLAAATALLQETLDHARIAGDHRWIARALDGLGSLFIEQGAFAAARPLAEEGLATARAARDRQEVAFITSDLGMVTLELGDTASARTYLAECLTLLRDSGRRRQIVFAIEGCAVLAASLRQEERAICLMATAAAMRAEMDLPIERDPRPSVVIAAGHSTRIVPTLLRLRAAAARDGRPVWSMDEAVQDADGRADRRTEQCGGPLRAHAAGD